MSRSNQSSTSSGRHRRPKPRRRNLTWLWIVLGALVVGGTGIWLLTSQAAPSVEITPAQAYAKLQQGAFFLDVRSQEEWNQFHIAGSILIPLDQLSNRLSEVPKDRDVVVVCLSGHRATSGTAILQQNGYKHVSCLSGGLTAWQAAGYPLVGETP